MTGGWDGHAVRPPTNEQDALITRHTTRWGFRRRGPFEGAEQYVEAVIAFLETRDWSAAFEVRLGKPQGAWTGDDVKAFHAHLTRPKHRAPVTPVAALFVEGGDVPATLDFLLLLAHRALDELARQLPAPPDGLPIYAHVVTLDGKLLVTPVSSGNRIGVLKMAAQQLPLFGFVLAFDAFVHSIDPVHGTATHRDTLLAHVGTRDDRHVLTRRYTVTAGAAHVEPETDTDMRAPGHTSFSDPYAELFVSVPPVGRPQ